MGVHCVFPNVRMEEVVTFTLCAVELVYMNQSPLELKCTKNDKPCLYCLKGLSQQIGFKYFVKSWQISV
jgi:hypothetical protein